MDGKAIWFGQEAMVVDARGKVWATARREGTEWNVYEADEGIHVGSVVASRPDAAVIHLVNALMVAAAEVDWVVSRAVE